MVSKFVLAVCVLAFAALVAVPVVETTPKTFVEKHLGGCGAFTKCKLPDDFAAEEPRCDPGQKREKAECDDFSFLKKKTGKIMKRCCPENGKIKFCQ